MQIAYSGPRMRGMSSTFQEWTIPPLSSNQYWAPNDVIKIMANITDGLVDPYRSHIEFDVVVSSDFQPVGLVQVDNSAQSFISQTVLLSNQVQIERIQQYDTIAAVLTDLGFSEYVCQARSGEGLGYNNIGTSQTGTVNTGRSTSVVNSISTMGDVSIHEMSTNGGMSPISAAQYTGSAYLAATDPTNTHTTSAAFTNTAAGNTTGGNWKSTSNWVSYPNTSTNGATSGSGPNLYTSQMGRAIAVRAEYNMAPQNNGYPDTPSSLPLNAPAVLNQNWTYQTMGSVGFSPNRPYQTIYGKQPPSMNNFVSIAQNSCGTTGYIKPIVSQFATGTQQPFVSATIPQVQMQNGMILPQPIPIATKTFRIPLISAVLGVLIPPDQFQLIPAGALKNFLLQITLNPFAMFTSGYSDIHQLDSTGMQTVNMQQRKWQLQNFQWCWHLYTFQNSQIQASIKEKLVKGITISSNMWSLSAQYQLPNGSYARNTFQIPVNVDSLAQVLILFLSNEYQTKTFCRKQFRLSNNITAMQLKANGQWFPLQPIIGNAGNPQKLDATGDNWNYYELLLLSNNFLFNTNTPLPRINQKNFAINGRFYDTNDNRTFMPASAYNLSGAATSLNALANSLNTLKEQSFNTSTALGQAWFHQNRFVGRAVYSYTFEPYGHSKGLINGLNTRDFRQFDVTFNNSPLNVFPSDQTMYIFTRSNVLVRYTDEGIQIMGL